MGFELRPYQEAALTAIHNGFASGGRRLLFTMPTGTGKTVVFARLLSDLHEQDVTPALVLAHQGGLLDQARDKILATAPHLSVGREQATSRAGGVEDVVVGSVQTLRRPNRLADFQPAVIIVDEAHHAVSDNSYKDILLRYGVMDGRALVVGCTATPKRLDKKALHTSRGSLFERCVYEYSLRQAIKEKFLSPLRGYLVRSDVDLDRVGTVAGDYRQDELAHAVDNQERTAALLDRWQEVAPGRRTLCFCVNIEHAENVAEAFRQRGVAAIAVHGGMDREEVSRVRDQFLSGQVPVVTNCMLWTEGMDLPPVDCIALLRPTQSWSLYVQMVGRGTRPSPGKEDCIVLDVVDISQNHNLTTLPAVLDLPPDLDLKGATLEEAAELIEALGEKAADFTIRPPKTLDEARLLLQEIDLLGEVSTPEELSAYTPYFWLPVPGGYLLSAPGNRRMRLTQDALGAWILTISDPPGDHSAQYRQSEGEELKDVVAFADDCVRELFSDCLFMLRRNARFRSDPVTEKQRAALLREGVSPDRIAMLTKGSAIAMLSRLYDANRERRVRQDYDGLR